MRPSMQEHLPIKDEEHELPVAVVWRPKLKDIVQALVERDYRFSRGIESLLPLRESSAEQIEAYIEDYGETLTELSDETWNSSISLWMRTYWDVLVDLWTIEAGRSDLVLHLRVFESGDGFSFMVDLVYVP